MPGQAHDGEAPHALYQSTECVRIPISPGLGLRERAVQSTAMLAGLSIDARLPPAPTGEEVISAVVAASLAAGFHTQVEQGREAVYVWMTNCGVCV